MLRQGGPASRAAQLCLASARSAAAPCGCGRPGGGSSLHLGCSDSGSGASTSAPSSTHAPPLCRGLVATALRQTRQQQQPSPPPRAHIQLQAARRIRDEQLAADGDSVAELFERSVKAASRRRPGAADAPPRLLSVRREALSLYREILRYSNLFVWRDAHGRMWRDLLRTNARKEFEEARVETDPEIINKLIITGRDAVSRTMESFMKRRNSIIEDEAAARERGSLAAPPPPPPPQDGYPRPRSGSMVGGSSGGILGVPPLPRRG